MGFIADQVASLERRLAEYEADERLLASVDVLNAVRREHVMAHGPEDQNWCWTCSCQYPCPTRRALGDL